jgi:hypothetical protein
MKKSFWIIIVLLILVIAATWYYQHYVTSTTVALNTTASSTPTDTTNSAGSGTQTFTSADGAITFDYPSLLTVNEKNNIITLTHSINYANTDACNMKGTPPAGGATSPTLTDFNVTIQDIDKPIVETIEQIDPTIATSSFSGEDITTSPGFIDNYSGAGYQGYAVTEGVEGCGYVTYYLPITTSETLVIQKQMIGALSSVADPANVAKILATPGAISPDQSTILFNNMMQTLQVQ